MKMFVLSRRAFADFDIPYEVPLFLSENKDRLKEKADQMNASLSEKEKEAEVSYVVGPSVPVI